MKTKTETCFERSHNYRNKRCSTMLTSTLSALIFAGSLTSNNALAEKVEWNDILQDQDSAQDVLMYGMGPKAQRYSKLSKINDRNIQALSPAWSMSFGDEKQRGQETQALFHDGTLYVTASYSRIFAIDARTGKQKWNYKHRLPEDIRPCCDVINRGAAIYKDLVFFGTLDAAVVALNKDTGKPVWKKKQKRNT